VKRLLVTGGQGKLAKQIAKNNKQFELFLPSRQEMDITIAKEVESYIKHTKPDIILHAAAYTRPMAKHKINPDLSLKTNIIGTANIVLSCMHSNIKMAYISTDYVYPGTQGNYKETDPVSPYHSNNDGIEKYGWSKLGGECVTKLIPESLILRCSLCDIPFRHKIAFDDVYRNSITHQDVADIILKVKDECGVINVGGEYQSVYDFVSQHQEVNVSSGVDIAPSLELDIKKLTDLINE